MNSQLEPTVPTPTPAETGVSGSQRKGPPALVVEANSPLGGAIADMREIANSKPRMFGGPFAIALLFSQMEQNHNDLEKSRLSIDRKDALIEELQGEITGLKVKIEGVSTELRLLRSVQGMKQVATFFGTAGLGYSIDLIKNNSYALAVVFIVAGLALLAVSIFAGKVKRNV